MLLKLDRVGLYWKKSPHYATMSIKRRRLPPRPGVAGEHNNGRVVATACQSRLHVTVVRVAAQPLI